jgi:hypothetical protein
MQTKRYHLHNKARPTSPKEAHDEERGPVLGETVKLCVSYPITMPSS